jgi:hypothetical protein
MTGTSVFVPWEHVKTGTRYAGEEKLRDVGRTCSKGRETGADEEEVK